MAGFEVPYAPAQRLRNARPVGATWLTARQREVLGLYADGTTRPEIVKALGISSKTLDGHVREAKIRLDARTLHQAVAMFAADRHPAEKPRGATVQAKPSSDLVDIRTSKKTPAVTTAPRGISRPVQPTKVM